MRNSTFLAPVTVLSTDLAVLSGKVTTFPKRVGHSHAQWIINNNNNNRWHPDAGKRASDICDQVVDSSCEGFDLKFCPCGKNSTFSCATKDLLFASPSLADSTTT